MINVFNWICKCACVCETSDNHRYWAAKAILWLRACYQTNGDIVFDLSLGKKAYAKRQQHLHEHTAAIEPDFAFPLLFAVPLGCACLGAYSVCRSFVNHFASDVIRFVYPGIVVKALSEFSLGWSYYILARLYLFFVRPNHTNNLINWRTTRKGWHTKQMEIQVILFNANIIMSFSQLMTFRFGSEKGKHLDIKHPNFERKCKLGILTNLQITLLGEAGTTCKSILLLNIFRSASKPRSAWMYCKCSKIVGN